VPACHGDSRNHQLPANGADAAVWGAHVSDQRNPRDCCQLPAVSCSPQFVLFDAGRSACVTPPCFCALSVIIHIVSRCHEEGLEHYLRSFLKVTHQHCDRDNTKSRYLHDWFMCVPPPLFFSFLVCVCDQQHSIRKLKDHPWDAGHRCHGNPQANCRFQHQQQTAQGVCTRCSTSIDQQAAYFPGQWLKSLGQQNKSWRMELLLL